MTMYTKLRQDIEDNKSRRLAEIGDEYRKNVRPLMQQARRKSRTATMSDPDVIEAVRKHPPRAIKPEERHHACRQKHLYMMSELLGDEHPRVSFNNLKKHKIQIEDECNPQPVKNQKSFDGSQKRVKSFLGAFNIGKEEETDYGSDEEVAVKRQKAKFVRVKRDSGEFHTKDVVADLATNSRNKAKLSILAKICENINKETKAELKEYEFAKTINLLRERESDNIMNLV